MARTTSKAAELSAEHRIVVLHGKEAFVREERTEELRQLLAEAFGDVEVFRFDGETVDRATVLDELRSYGLMQSHKVVLLDNAEAFLARGEDGGFRRTMERYAESPVDHATLLMRADTWRAGKIDKLITARGAIIKCDELAAPAAAAWCVKRAKAAYEQTMEGQAAALLVERLGTSLTRLDTEIAKLVAGGDAGGTITAAAVREMVGLSREEQGWIIQDAILSGSPKRALEKLHELIEVSRSDAEPLMWSMIDLCRKLHHASRLRRGRVPESVIAKELRLWGPSRDALLGAAGRLPPERFAQLLRSAIRADAMRKTGRARERNTLECLAVRIADTVG